MATEYGPVPSLKAGAGLFIIKMEVQAMISDKPTSCAACEYLGFTTIKIPLFGTFKNAICGLDEHELHYDLEDVDADCPLNKEGEDE